MEKTQRLRLIGFMDVKEVLCDHVGGQYILYREDIELVFKKEVEYVMNGNVIVTWMRDARGDRIEPHRIKHCPGIVLDVVLSSPVEHDSVGVSVTTSARPGFERAVIHKLDELHDQGDSTQQIAREVWELQKQMNNRLILIQRKTEAILTQQLELAEYPIPRLFIVLPENPVKYDPNNWFRTKFRLYFICECGEHTRVNGSKLPNHLHLAKHEGYLVREPTKFFKKYGPFLLVMLELIKFGTSIAGHVVPALASFKVVEITDSVKQSVESVVAKIDFSLECIDKSLAKVQESSLGDLNTKPGPTMRPQDLDKYLNNVEGLDGLELRQLGSFLKTSAGDSLLGNLYRMTTSEGHVKWVCLDHYRAGYQEQFTQKLRDVIKFSDGKFNEQLGRVEITIGSSFAVTEFCDAIRKAKGVVELILELTQDCSRSDLAAVEGALRGSRVSSLHLNLGGFQSGLGSKLMPTSTRYEALFHIAELPNMRVVHFVLPRDVKKILSFHSKKSSHLCKLSVNMNLESKAIGVDGAKSLAEALKNNSTLTTLNLENNSIGSDGAKALAEALKTNSTLTTLNLENNSIGSDGAKALAEALNSNSALTTLNLRTNSIGDDGAKALAEAVKTSNSVLTTLNLRNNSIGSDGAKALAEALMTNSTLPLWT